MAFFVVSMIAFLPVTVSFPVGLAMVVEVSLQFRKCHREGTRRTTPLLCSGVERLKEPRSGTAFRGESALTGIGGTSTT
jgi:hypothetical protein